ncbi:agmatine deiminase family protein [Streptomyces sp. NPDC053720]|uniref:agmatine deiminase family protein n=1 Tax=Streptomyces sp. NPDC053720 TaxID=3154855 RepID=UPI003423AFBF
MAFRDPLLPFDPRASAEAALPCYLCNRAVASGQFGDAQADAAARATLARLYPDRFIEQLDIDGLGTGGGIHCVTQQQPVW